MLRLPERLAAAALGAMLFPIKSLLVNFQALAVTMAALLMRFIGEIREQYTLAKKGGKSTFMASIYGALRGLLFLSVVPMLALGYTLMWTACTCFDILIKQPLRGIVNGFTGGLGSLFKQLTALSDDSSPILFSTKATARLNNNSSRSAPIEPEPNSEYNNINFSGFSSYLRWTSIYNRFNLIVKIASGYPDSYTLPERDEPSTNLGASPYNNPQLSKKDGAEEDGVTDTAKSQGRDRCTSNGVEVITNGDTNNPGGELTSFNI